MKRLLVMFLTLVLITSSVPLGGIMPIFAADGSGVGGDGTHSYSAEPDFTGYTEISTKEELNAVRYDLSGKFVLVADIVFTEEDFAKGGAFYNSNYGWTPIGTKEAPFTGVFDGNGHTVSGLKINKISSSTAVYAGLFGYASGVTIRNLGMVNSNICVQFTTSSASYAYTGGIVGCIIDNNQNDSVISNCYNKGNVTSGYTSTSDYSHVAAGGIVGSATRCIITDCYNAGVIDANAASNRSAYAHAAGIVGYARACTVSNCYNIEKITSTENAGGIAGDGYSSNISGCYNLGNITGVEYAGGILGDQAYGTVSECYNAGVIAASQGYAGGIIGNTYEVALSDSFNIGDVSADTDSSANAYAGGIAGYAVGTFTNCYNIGGVTAPSGSVGFSGGIAGRGSGTLTNCYYLDTIENGVEESTDTSVACTVEQLKLAATFVGFDFDTVWTMDGYEDYFYPEFKNVEMIYVREIETLEFISKPTKTEYLEVKDKLDVTGGALSVVYVDGGSANIDITPEMISGFDNTVIGKQTLTVTLNGKTLTYEIEIIAKSITSVEVTSMPTKTEYVELKDDLDLTGGKITVYYNNDTSDETDLIPSMVSGFDNAVLGEQTLTVIYNGYVTSFKIEIIEKSLASIAVTTNPIRRRYLEGKDELAVFGGKITLYYNNDTSDETDLTAEMVSGFDNTVVGEQTLTVTYMGMTATFNVEIVAKSISSIDITTFPSKLEYLEGKDDLNVDGGKLTVYYNNDTSEEVDITEDMVSGFDKNFVGEQDLVLFYNGMPAYYKIEVIAKSVTSVELTAPPSKFEYLEVKDALSVEDGKITVYYNNDTSEELNLEESMISGFDNTVIGEQTLTVTYGGKSDTYKIEVIAKTLTRIYVSKLPEKLTFLENKDPIDVTGGKIMLCYDNDENVEIDLRADMINGFDNTVVGVQALTVSYLGKLSTYNIEIIAGYILGDTNADKTVNSDDAIYLLKHTLFPDMYPINQKSDFDGNGALNSDDAIYLLKHTLFPDMYPLN